jgi:hypothetical protein
LILVGYGNQPDEYQGALAEFHDFLGRITIGSESGFELPEPTGEKGSDQADGASTVEEEPNDQPPDQAPEGEDRSSSESGSAADDGEEADSDPKKGTK